MKHPHLTEELQEKAMLYAAGALEKGERDEYSRPLEEDGPGLGGSVGGA